MAVSALQRHLHEAVQECVKTRDHLIIKRTVDKQKNPTSPDFRLFSKPFHSSILQLILFLMS